MPWSIVSGFKGLENDVVILAALTDIETDWHRAEADVGMSRARTPFPPLSCSSIFRFVFAYAHVRVHVHVCVICGVLIFTRPRRARDNG